MSFRVYPIVKTEPYCNDYAVTVNGAHVGTNTARVSRVPFNRRWPGHQRSIDQSEAIQFLSLEADEALTFEIRTREPFDAQSLRIRPRSLGVKPTVSEDGTITFTLERPAYFTVEPYGRSRALHVFVDPISDYKIDAADQSVIYFGAGEHDAGEIELHSNQTLYIDEGAVVYASVRAIDAENIRILGRGILDNRKNKETVLFEANAEANHEAVKNVKRTHTVQLEYCDNVEIDGITIRDSLVYNIRPIGCNGFTVKNVKIIGCWRYNSDGIDMHNCTDVHIDSCFIRTFDDSICVKGFDCYYEGDVESAVREAMYRNGKRYDVFRNALVERCVIWNDWGKSLEIGAETRGEEITEIEFCDCDIIHLTGPALDCMNVDYADVHDVTFRNIRIEADETIPKPLIQQKDSAEYENTDLSYMPTTISATVEFHHEYSAGGTRRGRNREMLFEEIRLYGSRPPRIRFSGYDAEHRTENILISNLYLNDVLIAGKNETEWNEGDFTDNVRIEADEFAEMKKNTVDSRGQLKESACIRFENPRGKGLRVMFVGNSITLHGVRPEVGWYDLWGMAASCKEKDYVNLLKKEIKARTEDPVFCICHASDWERGYQTGESLLPKFEEARAFGADIIIMRLIENCPSKEFDPCAFRREYGKLVDYLNGTGNAAVIVTTGFWRHPGDTELCVYAKENALDLVELGDLGASDEMKAIGLFWHKGVANHPGDKGMQAIADRLLGVLVNYIK